MEEGKSKIFFAKSHGKNKGRALGSNCNYGGVNSKGNFFLCELRILCTHKGATTKD